MQRPVMVWRCSDRTLTRTRVGLVLEAVAVCCCAILSFMGVIDWDITIFLAVTWGLFALGAKRFTFMPYLEARPDGLFIRNPISTELVPWGDIKRITPGYSGLVVEKSRGHRVSVWCVQENRIDTARGRRTRSADVIDGIATYREGLEGHARAPFVPSEEDLAENRKGARIAIALGLGALALGVAIQIARGAWS